MPAPIVERLNREIGKIVAMPEIREQIERYGGEVGSNTPAEMRALVSRQTAIWLKVVSNMKIKDK